MPHNGTGTGVTYARNGISSNSPGTSHTLAIVLAGGRGERLKHLTNRQAKPALLFGAKYRVIDFSLSNCINSGIRRVGVATQYRAYELINHVQRTWGFLHRELGEFVELWPAQQQTVDSGWYAGTADAVYRNIELIKRHRPQHVLILAGDHVYKQDYRVLIAEHVRREADVTICSVEVSREEASRFGVIQVGASDEIIGFSEKPMNASGLRDRPTHVLASMGIYVFNTEVLLAALKADARQAESSHDFGRDIIRMLIGQCRIFAHRFHQSCVAPNQIKSSDPYWRDVGTLDAYWSANMDLVHSNPPFELYNADWPVWTVQEQHPPARLIFDGAERGAIVNNAIIAEGCVVASATVRNAQLCTGVKLDARSIIEETVAMPGCEIGTQARIHRAILAPGCRIPAHMIIGENAEDDARRFHRTPNGIVVVTSRMLAQLEKTDISADRSKSVLPTTRIAPPVAEPRSPRTLPDRISAEGPIGSTVHLWPKPERRTAV